MRYLLRFTVCFVGLLNLSTGFAGNPTGKPKFSPLTIPAIAVAPDTLKATILNCNDSVTLPLTLYNTGGELLNFSLTQPTSFTDDFEDGLGKWVWDGYWGITTDAYNSTGALSEYPAGTYFNNMNQYIQMKDSIILKATPNAVAITFILICR
jgi:hypothetical protein